MVLGVRSAERGAAAAADIVASLVAEGGQHGTEEEVAARVVVLRGDLQDLEDVARSAKDFWCAVVGCWMSWRLDGWMYRGRVVCLLPSFLPSFLSSFNLHQGQTQPTTHHSPHHHTPHPSARFGRLDALVLNAGLAGFHSRRSAQGFDLVLGVNFLGHYALARALLPLLERTARRFYAPDEAVQPRVVCLRYGTSSLPHSRVCLGWAPTMMMTQTFSIRLTTTPRPTTNSSTLHQWSRADPALLLEQHEQRGAKPAPKKAWHVHLAESVYKRDAYPDSKLAQLLLAQEINRRAKVSRLIMSRGVLGRGMGWRDGWVDEWMGGWVGGSWDGMEGGRDGWMDASSLSAVQPTLTPLFLQPPQAAAAAGGGGEGLAASASASRVRVRAIAVNPGAVMTDICELLLISHFLPLLHPIQTQTHYSPIQQTGRFFPEPARERYILPALRSAFLTPQQGAAPVVAAAVAEPYDDGKDPDALYMTPYFVPFGGRWGGLVLFDVRSALRIVHASVDLA